MGHWNDIYTMSHLASTRQEAGSTEFRSQAYLPILIVLCIVLCYIYNLNVKQTKVNVPLEGSSFSAIASYSGAYEFIRSTRLILRQAYKKRSKGTFKVLGLDRETVVINKRELIDEIRKAPDDVFSSFEAVADILACRWTVGINVARNQYHAAIIQNHLTRSLHELFDDICDEITQSFNDLIPARENGWIAVPALETMSKIVCRTSNRVFVGLPLCRDQDYTDLSIDFTKDAMRTVHNINRMPVLLRPLVGWLTSSCPGYILRAANHLRPLLEERFRFYDDNRGGWPNKHNDVLKWIVDEAPDHEKRNVAELTRRILLMNLAAINTSSNSFTHALFHLVAQSEYIDPLRKEIERVVNQEGWTKVAMSKLWKLDSFMKESQRVNGIHLLTLHRKVMTDYTLSDGTFLPAGTFVAANATAIHSDEVYYQDAEKFDGFRFARMRLENTDQSYKHQMVNTAPDYLAFGHGRHACPGRFMVANELKLIMCHLLLQYDIKAEVEGVRPDNVYAYTRVSPNPTAKVLFRKRAAVS